MINYATVGTSRPAEAVAFYDALLGPIGMTTLFDRPCGGRIYTSSDHRWFGVAMPFDGGEATVGNGSMTGFMVDSREKVRAFYATALALGGTSEGEPGVRGPEEMGLYFAYVRDLDGNKLCAYRIGPEDA